MTEQTIQPPRWRCRRCDEVYHGADPDNVEQTYCRPETSHDWMLSDADMPECPSDCSDCRAARECAKDVRYAMGWVHETEAIRSEHCEQITLYANALREIRDHYDKGEMWNGKLCHDIAVDALNGLHGTMVLTGHGPEEE